MGVQNYNCTMNNTLSSSAKTEEAGITQEWIKEKRKIGSGAGLTQKIGRKIDRDFGSYPYIGGLFNMNFCIETAFLGFGMGFYPEIIGQKYHKLNPDGIPFT